MIYQARLLWRNENLEEEVLVQIGEVQLICFANICPYKIFENETYPVELSLFWLDEYRLEQMPDTAEQAILQVGNNFAHVITGRLEGPCLESRGVVFEDEFLLDDYGYLSGQMVRLFVDRLEIEFIR
ncbi:MAG TPA: hypothetical protein VMF06_22645 [Candidatus Limnocylindria bacterium]|jgi:hypothetical protein|nr:hypothetical protein [Candidatus Limnocylindria bacterium]